MRIGKGRKGEGRSGLVTTTSWGKVTFSLSRRNSGLSQEFLVMCGFKKYIYLSTAIIIYVIGM